MPGFASTSPVDKTFDKKENFRQINGFEIYRSPHLTHQETAHFLGCN